MERGLNQRFAKIHGRPLELDGATVHMSYKRRIKAGEMFTVELLSWDSPRVQSLSLRLENGLLEMKTGMPSGWAAGYHIRSSSITLWLDTSPPVIDVRCVEATEGAPLRVSNRWRHDDGLEDEWTNDAGMLIEDLDHHVVLRCSGGYSPPNFEDLVVELRFAAV